MSKSSISLTEGSLWKNILSFSIPLVFSQVLEVMFNLSDVAVVGRFADYKALGAVGSTTLLISLFTGLLIGIGSGVNVRTALALGARDDRLAQDTIHTSFIICTITGIIVFAVCFTFARSMLSLLNTKDELIDQAVIYLKIYAIGLPGMAVYNFGNGVLSAAGDTKRPLIYLTIAGVLNIILNLFFVIVCGLAAAGVAIASAVSQYVSAILVVAHLMRCTDSCRFSFGSLCFKKEAASAVLMLGIPSGLQNAIFAIANLFVQTGVNSFDAIMVSGNSAAANADSIIYNVMAAFHTACASFMSQNLGANKRDRMMKSYRISLLYSFLAGLLLGGSLFIFGREFLSIFATDSAVIDAGMQRIRIMGFSYCVSAFMDCTIAASRGIGKSIAPTAIVILGSCVFRIIWVYTVFAWFHSIPSLYLLYVFSWAITAVAEIIYFVISYSRLDLRKSEI